MLSAQVEDSTFLDSLSTPLEVDETGMEIDPNNTEEPGEPLFNKENTLKGLELMIFAQNGYFVGEIAPFMGVKVKDFLWFGAGVHGQLGLPLVAGYSGSNIYGAHAFGRINIAQSYFIIAEYRLGRGKDLSQFNPNAQWQATPVFGGGYQYGNNGWMYIGYAVNPKYAAMSVMGNLTYRIGFLFN